MNLRDQISATFARLRWETARMLGLPVWFSVVSFDQGGELASVDYIPLNDGFTHTDGDECPCGPAIGLVVAEGDRDVTTLRHHSLSGAHVWPGETNGD